MSKHIDEREPGSHHEKEYKLQQQLNSKIYKMEI